MSYVEMVENTCLTRCYVSGDLKHVKSEPCRCLRGTFQVEGMAGQHPDMGMCLASSGTLGEARVAGTK